MINVAIVSIAWGGTSETNLRSQRLFSFDRRNVQIFIIYAREMMMIVIHHDFDLTWFFRSFYLEFFCKFELKLGLIIIIYEKYSCVYVCYL